jgi:hypothetical protein
MIERIQWNGCWEKRLDNAICRWMVAWFNRGDNLYGAVAGYSGGGCFQLERFTIINKEISVEAYQAILFENEYDSIECEACLDTILSKHLEEAWQEMETLHLTDCVIMKRIQSEDPFITGDKMPRVFLKLFDSVGLITKPSEDNWI